MPHKKQLVQKTVNLIINVAPFPTRKRRKKGTVYGSCGRYFQNFFE